jgi:hypothetical protein
MAEDFYWQSKICMYECKAKISFNYGVLNVCKKILFNEHGMYHFDFFNLKMILIFYLC